MSVTNGAPLNKTVFLVENAGMACRKTVKPMSLPMDSFKLVPLHHQIYLTLRNEILAGQYASSADAMQRALPSESEMIEKYAVSRVTIRRALRTLETEGLVVKRHGSGTFPAKITNKARFNTTVQTLYDDLKVVVEGYKQKVLECKIIRTPEFLKVARIGFDDYCLHLCVISKKNDKPIHVRNHYIPEHLEPQLDKKRIKSSPLLLLLEEKGVKSALTDLNLSATAADMDAATHLKVAVGTPLISSKRLSKDADDRPIEYFEALTRPDLYEYRFQFSGPERDRILKSD